MAGRRNWKLRVWTLALLLMFPLLVGCSKEEEASAELALIRAEYEAADQSIPGKLRAFAPRYQALVKEYWGTEAALEAAIWLMAKENLESPRNEAAEVVGEFTDSILAEYAGSPGLWRLAERASLYSEDQRLRYFGELRKTSPHPEVRAAAIFYPARLRSRRLRPRPRPSGMPALAGSKEGKDPTALKAVENDLRLVLDEYGDLPLGNSTYGVMADAILNPHTPEELAMGQPAPEIVGKTVDGGVMRLSDFRGMVTVIDFWGDW